MRVRVSVGSATHRRALQPDRGLHGRVSADHQAPPPVRKCMCHNDGLSSAVQGRALLQEHARGCVLLPTDKRA